MTLPHVNDSTFVEREGILRVAQIVNRARALWRETPMHDVGIDGHIEYVDDAGGATGRTIAVQVKAGASYFTSADKSAVRFYPESKHRRYWSDYPLPVILILHHPEKNRTIWADARRSLRARPAEPIVVPLRQVFTPESLREVVLSIGGPLPSTAESTASLVEKMFNSDPSNEAGITFLDLFINGITDRGKALYFGMDLYLHIADWKLDYVAIGPSDHFTISEYVKFLVAHNLARVDFDWFSQSESEDSIISQFIAPLTARGAAVLEHLTSSDVRARSSLTED